MTNSYEKLLVITLQNIKLNVTRIVFFPKNSIIKGKVIYHSTYLSNRKYIIYKLPLASPPFSEHDRKILPPQPNAS